jgi:hypothetical protein
LRDIELEPYVARDGREYVVLEIKGCDRGPPLLIQKGKWSTPGDEHIPLRTYLSNLAEQGGKEIALVDSIDGRTFPRYQCATPKESWQETWLAIHRLFLEMRSAYRFLRGGKNAPNLWFGMTARLVQFDPLFRHTATSPAQREENRAVNFARPSQPGQAPLPSQRGLEPGRRGEAAYGARARGREDGFPFTRQQHPLSESKWRMEPASHAGHRHSPSYRGEGQVARGGYPGPPEWASFPGDPRGPDQREWDRMPVARSGRSDGRWWWPW